MMKSAIFWLAALFSLVASSAAAQMNLPPKLTYQGQAGTPIPAGPLPALAQMPPAFNETYTPTAAMVTTEAPQMRLVSGTEQSKARFTCSGAKLLGYVDQIRGPNKRPYGHLHQFFGLRDIDAFKPTFTQMREAAHSLLAAGKMVTTCPGSAINGSRYWLPPFVVANAMGDGVARAKPFDYITLYYENDHANEAFKLQPFLPGFQIIFGRNMDDPYMLQFRQRVVDAQLADPTLGFPNTLAGTAGMIAQGSYSCEDTPAAGSHDSLANLDGSKKFECPTNKRIFVTVKSNECWSGNLSSPDGFSNTVPRIRSSNHGLMCPKEFPYLIPAVVQIARYSHKGDYHTWRLPSDDHLQTLLQTPVTNGWSVHMDYQYGWDHERFGINWQCNIGIQFAGRTCNPHDLDFNTIGSDGKGGPAYRLFQNVDFGLYQTGTKLSHWITMPPIASTTQAKGSATFHAHFMDMPDQPHLGQWGALRNQSYWVIFGVNFAIGGALYLIVFAIKRRGR